VHVLVLPVGGRDHEPLPSSRLNPRRKSGFFSSVNNWPYAAGHVYPANRSGIGRASMAVVNQQLDDGGYDDAVLWTWSGPS
jgi:hypothetical protein